MKSLTFLTAGIFLMFFASIAHAQNWSQLGNDILGTAANDNCGRSVSLSGDGSRIAVSSHFHSSGVANSGQVRVFAYGGGWTQLGSSFDGQSMNERFGWSVALSGDGNTVAIGATHNDNASIDAGQVKVYRWDGTSWNQLGSGMDGVAVNDLFGYAVALSDDGNTLVASASQNDDNGLNAGHVKIFTWDGNTWNQLGNTLTGAAAGEEFGFSVDISGDGSTVIIGADRSPSNGTSSGQVRCFAWDGTNWVQRGSSVDGTAVGDFFGFSVSISKDANVIAGGATYNDGSQSNAGHVKVYEWGGTDWQQRGADIEGKGMNDESGYSISLNNNGDWLAIGATKNDDGGTDAGHVRVYRWMAGSWVQQGSDINGSQGGEYFGTSVSLTDDGGTLGVGAPINNQNGNAAGATSIWQMPGLGLSENHIEKLVVLPNPASTRVRIQEVPGRLESVSVYNLLGQEIYHSLSTESNFDVGHWDSGYYLVKIKTSIGLFSGSLVVK